MKQIPLTKGLFALVDDEDYEELSKLKWYTVKIRKTHYAKHTLPRNEKTRKYLFMHRVIMNITDSKTFVDHINGNGLDNTKKNLRIATHSQNLCNRGVQKNSTSGFTGVILDKRRNKYFARIKVNRRTFHLGYFDTPEAGARAYNEAAIKYHGEFAKLNNL